MHCEWIISSIEPISVSLVFYDVEFNDIFLVFDGIDSINDPVLIDGSIVTFPMLGHVLNSTSSSILVVFDSDSSGVGAGFLLSVFPLSQPPLVSNNELIDPPQDENGWSIVSSFLDPHDIIQPSNETHTWSLVSPSWAVGMSMVLEFKYFLGRISLVGDCLEELSLEGASSPQSMDAEPGNLTLSTSGSVFESCSLADHSTGFIASYHFSQETSCSGIDPSKWFAGSVHMGMTGMESCVDSLTFRAFPNTECSSTFYFHFSDATLYQLQLSFYITIDAGSEPCHDISLTFTQGSEVLGLVTGQSHDIVPPLIKVRSFNTPVNIHFQNHLHYCDSQIVVNYFFTHVENGARVFTCTGSDEMANGIMLEGDLSHSLNGSYPLWLLKPPRGDSISVKFTTLELGPSESLYLFTEGNFSLRLHQDLNASVPGIDVQDDDLLIIRENKGNTSLSSFQGVTFSTTLRSVDQKKSSLEVFDLTNISSSTVVVLRAFEKDGEETLRFYFKDVPFMFGTNPFILDTTHPLPEIEDFYDTIMGFDLTPSGAYVVLSDVSSTQRWAILVCFQINNNSVSVQGASKLWAPHFGDVITVQDRPSPFFFARYSQTFFVIGQLENHYISDIKLLPGLVQSQTSSDIRTLHSAASNSFAIVWVGCEGTGFYLGYVSLDPSLNQTIDDLEPNYLDVSLFDSNCLESQSLVISLQTNPDSLDSLIAIGTPHLDRVITFRLGDIFAVQGTALTNALCSCLDFPQQRFGGALAFSPFDSRNLVMAHNERISFCNLPNESVSCISQCQSPKFFELYPNRFIYKEDKEWNNLIDQSMSPHDIVMSTSAGGVAIAFKQISEDTHDYGSEFRLIGSAGPGLQWEPVNVAGLMGTITECPVGSSSSRLSYGLCEFCPARSFQNQTGQLNCIPCGSESYCPPGSISGNTEKWGSHGVIEYLVLPFEPFWDTLEHTFLHDLGGAMGIIVLILYAILFLFAITMHSRWLKRKKFYIVEKLRKFLKSFQHGHEAGHGGKLKEVFEKMAVWLMIITFWIYFVIFYFSYRLYDPYSHHNHISNSQRTTWMQSPFSSSTNLKAIFETMDTVPFEVKVGLHWYSSGNCSDLDGLILSTNGCFVLGDICQSPQHTIESETPHEWCNLSWAFPDSFRRQSEFQIIFQLGDLYFEEIWLEGVMSEQVIQASLNVDSGQKHEVSSDDHGDDVTEEEAVEVETLVRESWFHSAIRVPEEENQKLPGSVSRRFETTHILTQSANPSVWETEDLYTALTVFRPLETVSTQGIEMLETYISGREGRTATLFFLSNNQFQFNWERRAVEGGGVFLTVVLTTVAVHHVFHASFSFLGWFATNARNVEKRFSVTISRNSLARKEDAMNSTERVPKNDVEMDLNPNQLDDCFRK